MNKETCNIILIGMPGSGKSTVGVKLAEMLSYEFVDTDVLIEALQGRSLQDIVNQEGHMALRKIEEEFLLSFDFSKHVVATGGSAVYSQPAMEHLKTNGVITFLDVDLETLKSQIHNFGERGIARRPGQSLEDLYNERFPLYVRTADITIHSARLTPEEVCEKIVNQLEQEWGKNRFIRRTRAWRYE